jgi:hypothetical protein
MSNLNTDVTLEDYAELYRVITLTNGKTLLCTLVDENDKTVTFEYPIEVEYVKIVTQTGLTYQLSTVTYCPFTVDRTFTLKQSDILHINFLNVEMVKSYLNMAYGKNTIQDESVPLGTTVH